jgi:ABC-type polysaccharide/polyol phosphate export permease
MTLIICLVFHHIFRVDVLEYAPYLLAGLACWNYILNVSLQGCMCFFLGEAYIRQHPAPMAIYPLRTTLGAMIHFLLALMVVMAMAFYTYGVPSWPALLSLIPTLVLLFLLGWSLAVIGGLANVIFQDTKHLAEVGFQIVFYATPIMYKEKMLQGSHFGWLIQLNPFVAFFHLIRDPILVDEGLPPHVPSLTTFLIAGGTVLVITSIAAFWLARMQRRLIFYL